MKANELRKKLMYVFGFLFVFSLVLFILMILFWPKSSYTSDQEGTNVSVSSLICVADEVKDPFFNMDKAVSKKYELKTSFKGDMASEIMLTLKGEFLDDATAKDVNSRSVAKYNIFMSDHNINPQKYYPNFSSNKNHVQISLSSSNEAMSASFMKVVLSNSSDLSSINNKNHSELAKDYEAVGYSCEYSE